MNRKNTLSLILLLLFASISIASMAYASASTPAVPEFTVKYVDYSYDIPPSYTTDPYNGEQKMTYSGTHMHNQTIELTIKNQPFTPSGDINLYYNVRIKGYYEQSWRELFGVPCDGMTADAGNYRIQNYASETTFIRYTLPWDTPSSGTIEVQVQAMVGTPIISANSRIIFTEYSYGFNGTKSSWSNTQTVTFGNSVPPPTSTQPPPTMVPTATPYAQNPTDTPIQNDAQAPSIRLDWRDIALVILVAVVGVLVAVMLVWRRRKLTRLPNPNFSAA